MLRKKDKEKADLEKAKNELEGFIFDTQDKLSQEQYEICSTEEERQNILQQLSEASDWLYDQPEGTKKEVKPCFNLTRQFPSIEAGGVVGGDLCTMDDSCGLSCSVNVRKFYFFILPQL